MAARPQHAQRERRDHVKDVAVSMKLVRLVLQELKGKTKCQIHANPQATVKPVRPRPAKIKESKEAEFHHCTSHELPNPVVEGSYGRGGHPYSHLMPCRAITAAVVPTHTRSGSRQVSECGRRSSLLKRTRKRGQSDVDKNTCPSCPEYFFIHNDIEGKLVCYSYVTRSTFDSVGPKQAAAAAAAKK